jgi:Fic family protein
MEGPLLCPLDEKPITEATNSILQLQHIAELANRSGVKELRVSHVQDLHRLAVQGIYGCAGDFRTQFHRLTIDGSRHSPPEAWRVPGLVSDMIDRVNGKTYASELQKAAYLLWRCNWIHPFCGGNGRTARALAYLAVCLEHGSALPGIPSMPQLIMQKHADYTKALREADAAESRDEENIDFMLRLVASSFINQLGNAIRGAGDRLEAAASDTDDDS